MPLPLVLLGSSLAVILSHLTLLQLPYFWDEGGYYVPAALDFYRTGSLIPVFTNAHPPLPNVILGCLWHLFGFHILVTRIAACIAAAAALTSVFQTGRRLLSPTAGLVLLVLTGLYPIWFAQSSLAHADIFAAAFTLAALCVYLTSRTRLIGSETENFSAKPIFFCAGLFCLACLSKETAIVQLVALAALEAFLAFHKPGAPRSRPAHLRWMSGLLAPIPVLACWYAFHYSRTGQVFGNPVYLHYNATENFTVAHVLYAIRIRFVHLFWQRQMWLPLALAAVCLVLPPRLSPQAPATPGHVGLPRFVLQAVAVLTVANLLAFSVLGGALLTRYLLPVYPLLLLVCLAIWRQHVAGWGWLALLTGAAFFSALWLNPHTFFAPEDNLTYRNMIVVQQHAIDYLQQHYPSATVLTAWPVAAELQRPELGYTRHPFLTTSLENFTRPELAKALEKPGSYDTALVFTTHYASPAFRQDLLSHPDSWRSRRYAADIDLAPNQLAQILGGEVVWQEDLYGEWAAILRFPRTYDAHLRRFPLPSCVLSLYSALRYRHACRPV